MATHYMQMPGGQYGHVPSLAPAQMHRCPRCVSGSLVVTSDEWKCINCSHVVADLAVPLRRIARAPLIEFEPGKELTYRTGQKLDAVCDMVDDGVEFAFIRATFPRYTRAYVEKMIDYAHRMRANRIGS
jgi:hypothetical protein